MKDIDSLATVVSTDVLVIGAGISGLCAAITAGEAGAKVLLVDKATVGWTGMGTKAGHGFWVVDPEDGPDPIMQWHVRNVGYYLNDQELMESIANETYETATWLMDCGLKLTKDEDGSVHIFKLEGQPASLTGLDIDYTPLRERALAAGAQVMNKVEITDLLKADGKVAGAVGFSLLDGTFYVFRAKATIMATAGCNFNVARMWNGTGEGIAAAYRAGAQMRNPEIGNFYEIVEEGVNYPTNLCGEMFTYNALGESMWQKYVKGPGFDLFPKDLLLGIAKENEEGRGPVTENVEQYFSANIMESWLPESGYFDGYNRVFPLRTEMYRRLRAKEDKYCSPVALKKANVTLTLFGELGPIKVDHEARTTLEGLWAPGHVSYTGSCWAGAMPPRNIPGSSTANGAIMGRRSGAGAARYAAGSDLLEVDADQVARLKDYAFAPLSREGGIGPREAILDVQNVICPIKYNLARTQDRLEDAIGRIEAVKASLEGLCAEDLHTLMRCHEAVGIELCAEMIFRAALMRTESRGTHYRVDYPERDDANWLKWIVVQDDGGTMELTTEPVPIERYKIKPTDPVPQF